MREYQKILLCLDLTDDSDAIAERAQAACAERYGAELTLLHVVEYVPVEPMGEALLPAVQIEGELVERAPAAHRRPGDTARARAVRAHRPDGQHQGRRGARSHRSAAVDLIVIGSRERHGVSILFNFTEDTVLHAAPCDVLAVRLPKDDRRRAAPHGTG